MSRKRCRGNKVIHIEYTRGFNDLLKYEEVINTELDIIYQAYLKVIAELRESKDLTKPPIQSEIDQVIDGTLNKLGV